VESGRSFRLRDINPGDTGDIASKEDAQALLSRGVARLSELQEKLYAQCSWALLLIFQAMDAAGKDGTIKHVMTGVNPQGCQVYSFKAPSAGELAGPRARHTPRGTWCRQTTSGSRVSWLPQRWSKCWKPWISPSPP
jgi:hypothetical protein